MSDQGAIFTQFFLDLEVIFSSHTMFINASTKEFAHVNNAIPSHDMASEHLLYYKLAPPTECTFSPQSIAIFHTRIEGCH